MRSRIFGGLLSAVLACAVVFAPQAAFSAPTGQLKANTPLVAEPVAYTMLALPPNYQSDPVSQDLLRGFAGANNTLTELKSNTVFVTYKSSDPDFRQRFANKMPAVDAGKPAVLVTFGDEKLLCQYGSDSKAIANEVQAGRIIDKCRPFRPCTPSPDVSPSPEPQPEPATPIAPTVTPIEPTQPPPAPAETADVGKAVLLLAVAFGGVWMAFFRYRM